MGGGQKRKLSLEDELLLTPCNFLESDLAACFSVGQTTVSRIFRAWVLCMSHSFRDVSIWPSQAYKCSKAPTAFEEQYPTTQVIINATEFDFPIAKPSNPTVQSTTCSSYKNRNTLKLLNRCTPNSALSFVSKVMVAVFQTRSWQREVAYLKSCSQETQSWLTVASTSGLST